MTAFIKLKDGNSISIPNFKYITYHDGRGGVVKVEKFEEFYLYHKLLNFVGEKSIVSLDSKEILFVKFED